MNRSDVGRETDRGSTLVEQLVVMVLLVGLGLIISTVTISLARSTGEHSRRVDGLHQQQLAMEVLTRDLRAADPLVSTTPLSCEAGRQPSTSPAFPSCANELALDLTRQGLRWRVTYSLQSGALVRAQQQWTGERLGRRDGRRARARPAQRRRARQPRLRRARRGRTARRLGRRREPGARGARGA